MTRLFRLSAPLVLLAAGLAHAQGLPPPSGALPDGAARDAWVAARTFAPGEMIRAEDVQIRPLDQPLFGTFSIDRSPAGLEAKHRIMAGRTIMERDVGRHALVHANAVVRVTWQAAGIHMDMDGRALQEGSAGDAIRVLNTTSSRTMQGVVQPDGSVQVGSAS